MSDQKRALADLRLGILTRLAFGILNASERLHHAAAGRSVFSDQAQLQATLALLRLVPTFLEEMRYLDSDEKAAKLKAAIEERKHRSPPLIPKCEVCGAGPGAHWTEDCVQNPTRRKLYPPD